MVLTADKGVCLVVMDREEYIKKAKELLNQGTYKIIPTDPTTITTNQKSKLISLLMNTKAEGGINEDTCYFLNLCIYFIVYLLSTIDTIMGTQAEYLGTQVLSLSLDI